MLELSGQRWPAPWIGWLLPGMSPDRQFAPSKPGLLSFVWWIQLMRSPLPTYLLPLDHRMHPAGRSRPESDARSHRPWWVWVPDLCLPQSLLGAYLGSSAGAKPEIPEPSHWARRQTPPASAFHSPGMPPCARWAASAARACSDRPWSRYRCSHLAIVLGWHSQQVAMRCRATPTMLKTVKQPRSYSLCQMPNAPYQRHWPDAPHLLGEGRRSVRLGSS